MSTAQLFNLLQGCHLDKLSGLKCIAHNQSFKIIYSVVIQFHLPDVMTWALLVATSKQMTRCNGMHAMVLLSAEDNFLGEYISLWMKITSGTETW